MHARRRARRAAFRASYLLLLASGRVAAGLARDFRTLGAAGGWLVPLAVLLQLPVLACWACVRPISLAAYAACRSLERSTPSRAPSG
jgi:hypothetical protein